MSTCFVKDLDDAVVVLLTLDNSSVPATGEFFIELFLLSGQIDTGVGAHVLFILCDEHLEIGEGLAGLDTRIDLLTDLLDMGAHISEEVLNLGDHESLDVLRINLSHITETVLILHVLAVELPLEISGDQSCEHLLRFLSRLGLDSLKLEKALIAHLLARNMFVGYLVHLMLLTDLDLGVSVDLD